MSQNYDFTPFDVIARFIQDETFRKELIALFSLLTTFENTGSQTENLND